MTHVRDLDPRSPVRTSACLCLLTLLTLLGACSPLRTFNSLVPKDQGSTQVASDIAFGPQPRQRLDLYRPDTADADEQGPKLPVIVFIYGGSWQTGEKGGYAFVGRALAARGFLVAIPDYRLVPQIRYPAFVEDNAAAVRWLVSNAHRYGGDPSRILIMGHSAGAYNAAMLALDPRWLGADRPAIKGFVGLAGPYDFLPLEGPVTTAAFGGEPRPATTQPINFVSADDPPALLLHGARDSTVYPRNSRSLQARLARVGADARMRIYPDLGHVGIVTALSRPFRRKAPVLDDVTAFATQVSRQPRTG